MLSLFQFIREYILSNLVYLLLLQTIDSGGLGIWKTKSAPLIARRYWRLKVNVLLYCDKWPQKIGIIGG